MTTIIEDNGQQDATTIDRRDGVDFFNNPETALSNQIGGRHYRHLPIPPFDFCRKNGIGHAEGEAIYHIVRHKNKNCRADLEKAIHWLQLIIEHDYNDREE